MRDVEFSEKQLNLEWPVKKGGHSNYKKRNSSKLELKTYQLKIIQFVESKEKKFSDFSWTFTAQKFNLYEYFNTQSLQWNELKQWFNLQCQEIAKNRSMNQDVSVDQYINPNTGLFECDINGKTKPLSQWVTNLFNITKSKLLITENSETSAYYESFFKALHLPDFDKIQLFTSSQVREICDDFENNVINKESMIAYLKRIPGLYARLYIWCVENSYEDSKLKQNHHVLPNFLVTSYGYSKKAIEANHNLITIDWAVHFILHIIRFIEYGQMQDYTALSVLLSIKGSPDFRFDYRLRVVSLCNWLNEYLAKAF